MLLSLKQTKKTCESLPEAWAAAKVARLVEGVTGSVGRTRAPHARRYLDAPSAVAATAAARSLQRQPLAAAAKVMVGMGGGEHRGIVIQSELATLIPKAVMPMSLGPAVGRVGTPLHRSSNLGRCVSFGTEVGTSSGLDEANHARRNVARAPQQTRRE